MPDGQSQHIAELHQTIDRQAKAVAAQQGARLQCGRGCSDCCVDGIAVHAVEADHIRAHHADLLQNGQPAPPGQCAFLNLQDRSCRIYPQRPYVCRTQGLPLRWLQEEEGQWLEYRDICPLNEAGPPLEHLPESACWTIGPTEGRLAQLQAEYSDLNRARIPLRSLFVDAD